MLTALPSFAINAATLYAMCALYALLAVVSTAVGLKTAPDNTLRLQVNAWWMLFPFVSISLLWYRVGPILLTLLIAVLAQRELAMHHAPPRGPFRWLCLACIVLQTVLALYGNSVLFDIVPWLVVAQALHFGVRRKRAQLLLLLFLLLCYGLSFVARLYVLPQAPELLSAWCFYLFALTALNDIAQFVSGKCFGRHKIAKTVSPNKTWQGLIGGMVISVLVSVGMGLYLQLSHTAPLVGLALLLSLGGFAGDLLFSAAKRYLGIKDFSQLIPGHGGILDRVDSLVLTAPLLYYALTVLNR